jgi:hypothetical protein
MINLFGRNTTPSSYFENSGFESNSGRHRAAQVNNGIAINFLK